MAAYLTLAEAKRHLGGNLNSTDKDALIGDLINAACDAVERYLERPVLRRELTELYDADGADFLYLRCAPAVVSAVYLDPSRQWGAETLLRCSGGVDDQYSVPDDADRIELLGGRFPGTPERPIKRVVKVVYQGGWTEEEIPAAVRQATCLTVQNLWAMDGGGKGLLGMASVSSPAAGSVAPVSTIELTRAIPKAARELLAPYRQGGL